MREALILEWPGLKLGQKAVRRDGCKWDMWEMWIPYMTTYVTCLLFSMLHMYISYIIMIDNS